MVGHRGEAPAEGLWVTAAPGHCCFSQTLQHSPVKALQAVLQTSGRESRRRNDTTHYSQGKGFCIRDYVTFDMSYISSTRELRLCPATLAATLDSHC